MFGYWNESRPRNVMDNSCFNTEWWNHLISTSTLGVYLSSFFYNLFQAHSIFFLLQFVSFEEMVLVGLVDKAIPG